MTTIKNKHHLWFLREIKKKAEKETKEQKDWLRKYMGTNKIYYPIKSEIKNQIVKKWVKDNANLSIREYENLLTSLHKGTSHQEFTLVGRLLEYLPKLRRQLDIKYLDKWLDKAKGWGEVDSICQSNFSSKELLTNWGKWQKLILKLSKDKNISKRRASLVLLTKSVRESGDKRLSKLAFLLVDKLKREKDVLITKAISWLLRELVENNRKAVGDYLKDNDDLPKIAIRETRNELLTGRK